MMQNQHPLNGPDHNCQLCPRLADFLAENRVKFPEYFNGPVPPFGDPDPWLLIVGLAPGLHGANRTGRPFTGDYAGDLLYDTLCANQLASGVYDRRPDDGLQLHGCKIINAVRCVPPANKPTPQEIKTCLPFLDADLKQLPRLKIIIALGTIAHNAVLTIFNAKKSAHKFGHGAEHKLVDGLTLIDSYHCSRYNTNTGRLTPQMFQDVFTQALTYK